MGTFSAGQRVRVQVDGTYQGLRGSVEGLYHVVIMDNGKEVTVRTTAEDHISALEPKNWPPKPGDLWETPDGIFFASECHADPVGLMIHSGRNVASIYAGQFVDKYPTTKLIYRNRKPVA